MKAKDIMIPLYDYLKPENTIKEAAYLLRTAKRTERKVGVKGLPVVDNDGKLIGILSMGDILKAVFPAYMYLMNLGRFTWDGMLYEMAKKASDYKVKDFMTANVLTVREDHPLMECVDRMLKYKVQRLPVLDSAGNVKGMLYKRDVFNIIAKAMLDEKNNQSD